MKPRNTVLLTKPFPWIRTALSSQPTRTVLGVVIAIAVVVIVTFLYDHSFTNFLSIQVFKFSVSIQVNNTAKNK